MNRWSAPPDVAGTTRDGSFPGPVPTGPAEQVARE